MRDGLRIALLIPARDEEAALPFVLQSVPDFVDHVVVCDNGSSDATAQVARAHAALVATEPKPGYGAACLAAIACANALAPPPDIVVFADADGSDDLSELCVLLGPVLSGSADLVIGSRIRRADPGALTPVQWFGNQFAGALVWLVWGVRMRDLGPFRALRRETLAGLDMRDRDFGWTVEMQIKAARMKLRVVEIDVNYRKRRAGQSKISQTLVGSWRAGVKILSVIAREALTRAPARQK
jgi:glycosyltransferase involved in cell wall biosynthesis